MSLYTTADFLTGLKLKAAIPDNQDRFSNSNLLKLANDELKIGIVPLILRAREDYYRTYTDFSSGSLTYTIPSRAVGMKLHSIYLVNSSSDETEVDRVEINGNSFGYRIQYNTVIFNTAPTDTVRMYYHIRPNALIETKYAAIITDITGNDITVDSLPSNITASTTIDIMNGDSSYKIMAADQAITSIASNVLTMTATPDSSLGVGDHIALAGYSSVIQMPEEFQPVLEWRITENVLNSIGDYAGRDKAKDKRVEAEVAGLSLIEPRVDATAKIIVNEDTSLRGDNSFDPRIHNNHV